MLQEVAENSTFTRQATKLFSEDEKRELINFLARNPLAGDHLTSDERQRASALAATPETTLKGTT